MGFCGVLVRSRHRVPDHRDAVGLTTSRLPPRLEMHLAELAGGEMSLGSHPRCSQGMTVLGHCVVQTVIVYVERSSQLVQPSRWRSDFEYDTLPLRSEDRTVR